MNTKIRDRVQTVTSSPTAGKTLLKAIFLLIVLAALTFGFGSPLMRGQLP